MLGSSGPLPINCPQLYIPELNVLGSVPGWVSVRVLTGHAGLTSHQVQAGK